MPLGFWPAAILVLPILAALVRPRRAGAEELPSEELAPEKTPAIVLAAFGTTVPEALPALENVEARVRKNFPGVGVHLAFTSNMIREVWRKRAESGEGAGDPVVARYAAVKSPLAVLADLQEAVKRIIAVQSLHLTDGEEYSNLDLLVKSLSGIKASQKRLVPFPDLRLGPPALGLNGGGGQPYMINLAAEAL